MSRREGSERLLRWYPASWRARYGAELVALMEDLGQGQPPDRGFRSSVARAGLRERLHALGVLGPGSSSGGAVASGSFIVLWAFGLYVLGGIGFAKFIEHWPVVTPATAGAPRAVDLMQVLAVVALGAVLAGAAVAAPAAVRALRAGCWPEVRRRFVVLAIVGGATALVIAGMVLWAHHLTSAQRNGGLLAYQVLGGAGALMVAGTLATAAGAAVALGRRSMLSAALLRVEGALAGVVAVAMVAMTACAGLWWATMAARAPLFLSGGRVGTVGPVWAPTLALAGGAMVVAVGLGVLGTARIVAGWRAAT